MDTEASLAIRPPRNARLLAWFCIALLIVQAGCATSPLSQLEHDNGALLTIGVASAPLVTATPPPARPLDRVEGAAAGAAAGLAYAALLNLVTCALIVPFTPIGCAAAVPGLVATPVAGAMAGAAFVEPPQIVRGVNEARAAVSSALGEPNVRAAFRGHVIEHGRKTLRHRFADLPDGAPSRDVDVVLEVGIVRIDVASEPQASVFALAMQARAMLIHPGDRARIASRNYRFTSETRHIAAWAENDAHTLRAAIDRGLRNFAEQITDDLLRGR